MDELVLHKKDTLNSLVNLVSRGSFEHILTTVFFPIEAPGAKAGVRGASIFSSRCIDFQNIHEKATGNTQYQNDVLKYHIHVLFPKAIQNKLCILSRFFPKGRGERGKKKTHTQ